MRIAVIQPLECEVSASGHAAFHPLINAAHASGADVVITPTGTVGTFDDVVRLTGDECFERARYDHAPMSVVVLVPRAESELQAQAVIEYAVGLSESVTGLVVVVEPSEVGGSAIVFLGEVVDEAGTGEHVISADVPAPVPRPVPPAAFPDLSPVLAQRLRVHGRASATGGAPEGAW